MKKFLLLSLSLSLFNDIREPSFLLARSLYMKTSDVLIAFTKDTASVVGSCKCSTIVNVNGKQVDKNCKKKFGSCHTLYSCTVVRQQQPLTTVGMQYRVVMIGCSCLDPSWLIKRNGSNTFCASRVQALYSCSRLEDINAGQLYTKKQLQ